MLLQTDILAYISESTHLPERLGSWNLISRAVRCRSPAASALGSCWTSPPPYKRPVFHPSKPTAASQSWHSNNVDPPFPRVPCSVLSLVPLLRPEIPSCHLSTRQNPPYPPSLSSNALSYGSSSRIAQAEVGASSSGPLTNQHRHTHVHANPSQPLCLLSLHI